MNFRPNGKKETQKKFWENKYTIWVQNDILLKQSTDNTLKLMMNKLTIYKLKHLSDKNNQNRV